MSRRGSHSVRGITQFSCVIMGWRSDQLTCLGYIPQQSHSWPVSLQWSINFCSTCLFKSDMFHFSKISVAFQLFSQFPRNTNIPYSWYQFCIITWRINWLNIQQEAYSWKTILNGALSFTFETYVSAVETGNLYPKEGPSDKTYDW